MSKTIPLTQGYVAIVDDEDYEELSRWKWYADVKPGRIYARRNVHIPNPGTGYRHTIIGVVMHRQVLRLPQGDPREGDHINGNTLDNTRGNLRIVNRSQNQQNAGLRKDSTSGCKGVSWHRPTGQWQAYIQGESKKRVYLGIFRRKEDAVAARKAAEKIYYGEYARKA